MTERAATGARPYRGKDIDQRRAERRARLLDAALELFTSTGYQHAGIARICTLAGVSTRNFYEEFSGKEAVLCELHERINAVAMERVTAVLDEARELEPAGRIRILLDAFLSGITADPRVPRLAYVEAVGVSPALERQHRRWVEQWASYIASEAERVAAYGQAPSRDYRLTALGLVGAITELLRAWQAGSSSCSVSEIAEEIRELMLDAIIRRPAQ
ncbi:transcriptional regulator, TetR family [Haloechinothrix alba]|uniref:Transcriptional regulator, TetR family n=1 Tax=Haloechinothrix alba TaxID=664784 RepID=A0A238YYT7_9PSEU|nr:TetR/AcrR family transcriptional regulator [Haloechinothrix alba]SNR76230.1 transcriptional regulator, TetR family [Haloechinothrix alba]